MLKTYIEPHASSLAAQTGEEEQNERDEPRAGDEDDDVRWRRERLGPGLRNWTETEIERKESFKTENISASARAARERNRNFTGPQKCKIMSHKCCV